MDSKDQIRAVKFVCDGGCSAVLVVPVLPTADAGTIQHFLRRCRWSRILLSEEWRHFCPLCW